MDKLENDINDLEFNIFEIKELTHGDELSLILYFLFRKNDLFERLNIPITVFSKFSKRIQQGYLLNLSVIHNY